jgi:hypothetical protein
VRGHLDMASRLEGMPELAGLLLRLPENNGQRDPDRDGNNDSCCKQMTEHALSPQFRNKAVTGPAAASLGNYSLALVYRGTITAFFSDYSQCQRRFFAMPNKWLLSIQFVIMCIEGASGVAVPRKRRRRQGELRGR